MNAAQRYDKLAPNYDKVWRRYNRAVHDEVLRHVPDNLNSARVLDVGCGTGEWLQFLIARRPEIAHAVGIEPSREMLNKACERFGRFLSKTSVELLQQSAEELKFQNSAFGLVTCLNVLHYLQNAPQFFADAHRVLDVGGTLVVQDYTHNRWPFFAPTMKIFDGRMQQIYTPRELNDLASNAGLNVRYARSFRISKFWRGAILVAKKS